MFEVLQHPVRPLSVKLTLLNIVVNRLKTNEINHFMNNY